MSDELALLRAVRAARDDDTPRLVYADWLDEHGDPARAEFIRVQCWLSANPQDHPHARRFRRREQALARANRERWDAPFTGYINNYGTEYDRGFPTWFSAHEPTEFAAVLSELITMTATDRLRIGGSTEESIVPLVSDPAFVAIRELQVAEEGRQFVASAVDKLVRSSHAQQLVRLELSASAVLSERPGIDELARMPVLPHLEYLHSSCVFLPHDHEYLFALLCSPHRQRLRGLAVWYVDEATVIELASLPELARFTHLDLGYSQVTDAAAVRLAESPHLDRIELLTAPGQNNDALTDFGRVALRERFGHRVELDPAVLSNGPARERHYYRTVTGRRV